MTLENYDYQQGYCHYFANKLKKEINKKFPNLETTFFLLLGINENKNGNTITEYLIHVYILINKNILLDSNGTNTFEEATNRLNEWEIEQINYHNEPDEYLTVYEDTDNKIPKIFFNKSNINHKKINNDIKKFLSNSKIQKILIKEP